MGKFKPGDKAIVVSNDHTQGLAGTNCGKHLFRIGEVVTIVREMESYYKDAYRCDGNTEWTVHENDLHHWSELEEYAWQLNQKENE